MDASAQKLYRDLDSALSGVSVLLDVGCGRGVHLGEAGADRIFADFRRRGGHVIGIDVDPAGETNPFVDEFHRIDVDQRWPLEDASVDVAFCDWVLEHVTDPDAFFAECSRVLRPGGRFTARTMQAWGVAGIGARLVPDRFHVALVRRLQPGMQEEDVFPTALRANSRAQLRRVATSHGLSVSAYDTFPTLYGYSAGSRRLETALKRLEPLLPTAMHHGLVVSVERPRSG